MSPVEYVVHSAQGEAVVRTCDQAEAERIQRILRGRIEQHHSTTTEQAA